MGRVKVETAVLLVAGQGARLLPLTADRPKCLVEIEGKSILERSLAPLLAFGIREFVFVTGYQAEAVERALEPLRASGARVALLSNPAFERTQTGASLALCEDAVGPRPFFKLDGDVLYRPEVLERLAAAEGELRVAVDGREDLGDEEMKVLARDGRIKAFGKQLVASASSGESLGIELVTAGAGAKIFPALRAAVREGDTHLYYEDVYQRLVDEGLDARSVDVTDLPWIEIDTPEDLERAAGLVKKGLV